MGWTGGARIGLVKIAILNSDDVSDQGTPIWNVVLQQAPLQNMPQGAPTQSENAEVGQTEAKAQRRAPRRKPRRRKEQQLDTDNEVPLIPWGQCRRTHGRRVHIRAWPAAAASSRKSGTENKPARRD